nr:tetratricopeptide repeat protein [Deltaproteobacteria bacterium]
APDRVAAKRLGEAFSAYHRGDLVAASTQLSGLDVERLANRDYVWWLRGMVALRTANLDAARKAFEQLDKQEGSRFRREAPWRLADLAWERGDRAVAAKAYAKLVGLPVEPGGPEKPGNPGGDLGTALFRIAETKTGKPALAAYRAFLLGYPAHPLAARAERLLAERGAPALTSAERLERAKRLTDAHLWDEAVAEMSLLDPATLSDEDKRQRDYWLGTTLFKMRRRYDESAELLLGVYPKMGASAAEAMFHGGRAKSRSDQDDEAIAWYRKVVAAYPKTSYAEEAQFLSGWLEFNRGKYREALGPLEDLLARYPKSKWVDESLWFLGMAHYFLGEWPKARIRLVALAKLGGSLEAGKGMYWLARLDEKLGAKPDAIANYTRTLQRYPFSWYALLSRARLKALDVELGPFGVADPQRRGGKLAATADEALAEDELIRRADELIAANLMVDAGNELERGERAFLKRVTNAAGAAGGGKGAAVAMLLDRYTKAGNFNRPWMLAIT